MKSILLFIIGIISNAIILTSAPKSDTIKTSSGNLIIHFVGHGTLYFEYEGKVIHVDPFSRVGDYSALPKADMVLITHSHGDHFDTAALKYIVTDKTITLYTAACEKTGKYQKPAMVIQNGDKKEFLGIPIEAVPAYNIVNKRQDGNPFHPKGEGNGYIIAFADKRIYIGGDTELIPEMSSFGRIDVAFIPMNLPYTMTPELAAEAARVLKPSILYPYHFGNTDTSKLLELLKDDKQIEVRIRDME